MKSSQFKTFSYFSALILMAACATESSRKIEVQQTEAAETFSNYRGPRHPIMVGNFENKSNYMRGMFSDGDDRLGNQAKTVLIGHLQRTRRFNVLERNSMKEMEQEAKFKKKKTKIKGADFLVTGAVAEFGRKEIGDMQLFGIIGGGKKQIAYSKVTLNVVNTETSEVVYSASGAGEHAMSDREVLGFGTSAGYDSTLNEKVLDLAIRQAVDGLVKGLEGRQWEFTSK